MIASVFRLGRSFATAVALLALPGAAAAAEPVQQHNSNAVWFENWVGLSKAQLRVATPTGKIIDITAETGTPVFLLNPSEAVDGVYRYELTAATDETAEIVNPIDNGRGAAERTARAVPFHATGHFIVARGVIITPELTAEDGNG